MATSTQPTGRSARYLLDAGVVAGPLFVAVGLAQALSRDGFDLSHQPLSLLSLGDLGWIQITNFVVAGSLCLAFAVGVARTITSGPARTWAPRLFGVSAPRWCSAGSSCQTRRSAIRPVHPTRSPTR